MVEHDVVDFDRCRPRRLGRLYFLAVLNLSDFHPLVIFALYLDKVGLFRRAQMGDFYLHIFGQEVPFSTAIALLAALGFALGFEFVNGFHDTANAVATVIYTHTFKPVYAVVWSGNMNLIGVLTSGWIVAYSIVALLPVELVLNVGSSAGVAMVFSLLISAIIWNLERGIWVCRLPVLIRLSAPLWAWD